MSKLNKQEQIQAEREQKEYLEKILGPFPGGEARCFMHLSFFFLTLTIVLSILTYVNESAGVSILTIISGAIFVFLIFCIVIGGGSSSVNIPHHQELTAKIISGEIKPDFYYPAFGNSDYLILDHSNEKLWINTECYPISEIRSIYLNSPGNGYKNYRLSFYFNDITIAPATRQFPPSKNEVAQVVYSRVAEELGFT